MRKCSLSLQFGFNNFWTIKNRNVKFNVQINQKRFYILFYEELDELSGSNGDGYEGDCTLESWSTTLQACRECSKEITYSHFIVKEGISYLS